MPDLWIVEFQAACRRMSHTNDDFNHIVGEICGTDAYWSCHRLFANPATRDNAMEMLQMMVNDVLKRKRV